MVLQNFTLTERGKYINELTDEQMARLKRDLAAAGGGPTITVWHFPPLLAIEFVNGRAKAHGGSWTLGTDRMCRNPAALSEAIQDANARAFFGGHIHRLDRTEAGGLTMICAGSDSGARWRGPRRDTREGRGVIDCRPDGSFDCRYHSNGRDARP